MQKPQIEAADYQMIASAHIPDTFHYGAETPPSVSTDFSVHQTCQPTRQAKDILSCVSLDKLR